MKVINSWDLPEEPTMNSRCADCNYEDCRCDRPPMPAASPWRTDVENAPKDGSRILGYFSNFGTPVVCMTRWEVWAHDSCWGGKDCFPGFAPDEMLAFATINPPETTNDYP